MEGMMKAARKTKKEPGLDLVEIPIPKIQPNQVLVKVGATAICGSDIHFYAWDGYAQTRLNPPLTLGHEFAGEIVEVGAAVQDYKLGEHVTADSHIVCGKCDVCKIGLQHICANLKIFGNEVDGSFAEYVAVPETSLWRLPMSTPWDVGAIMEPLGGAVQAVLIEPVTAKSVVIYGDGPIALFAAGVARASGARKVYLVGMVPERLEIAKRMGADTVFNVTEDIDPVQAILDENSRRRGCGGRDGGGRSLREERLQDRAQGRPGDDLRPEPQALRIRHQLFGHPAAGDGARGGRAAHVGHLAPGGRAAGIRTARSAAGDHA